jgi:hypothetical protein
MVLQAQTGAETAPKIYSVDDTHLFLNWVARGTDGSFYMVPSAPGGWKQRRAYEGRVEELKPVSPQKARAIVKFVGGDSKDWGPVTIAEEMPSIESEYMAAPFAGA